MLTVVLLSGVELGIAASGAELDGIGVVADLNNDVEFRTSVTSVLRVTPDSNLRLVNVVESGEERQDERFTDVTSSKVGVLVTVTITVLAVWTMV